MAIRVFNSLSHELEELVPQQPGKIGMYLCGPTVYNRAHVGNLRTFVSFDMIRRYLMYRGFEVTFVQNITDVDDKMIQAAQERGITIADVRAEYLPQFLADQEALGILPPTVMPLATEHIPDMIALIERLIDRGLAYEAGGDVYFSVPDWPDYGRLIRQDPEQLQAGARVEVGGHKRHPHDFVLWKAQKPGEPAWDSPWGPGRPGWHIECSAMSLQYLEDGIDFHGGGMDLIFPHHENEIAQSEAYGIQPFVRYWVHNGLLQVKDEKMSKSLGNFISINDVLREHPKEVVRFFILSTHYRSPVDYSPEKIGEARRGWERLNGIYQRLAKFLAGQGFDGGGNWQEIEVNELSPGERQLREAMEEGQENFIGAMEDDFNTALAMAALFQLGREINSFLTNLQPPYGTATLGLLAGALGIMQELGGQILGIFPPVEEGSNEAFNDVLQILLDVRTEAKKKKDYATADAIRDRLREVGIILEDTPQGVNWHWA